MTSRRPSKDLVLVHGRAADGSALGVLRAREERVEVGIMKPLEEGKPIHGEVVKLSPRPEMPLLFDAETQYVAPSEAASEKDAAASKSREAQSGPPQVATDAYRKNWDAIWRRPGKSDKLVN